MAGKIKVATGFEPELIRSRGGVFDVVVDGKLIYSKDETGKFPDESALVSKIVAMK